MKDVQALAEKLAGPYHDRSCAILEDRPGDHPCNCLRETRVQGIVRALTDVEQAWKHEDDE